MSFASMIPGVVGIGVADGDRIVTNTVPLIIYGIYLSIYIISGIVALIIALKRLSGTERQKIMIVLLGLIATAFVGLIFNLFLPILGNYDYVGFGSAASLIFVVSSTYVIVRHRMFDIRLAAVRTIAYALALFSLAIIYYVMAYLVSVVLFQGESSSTVSISPANIMLALVLAYLFQPIKRVFDRITNDIFYRDNYKSEDFLASFSNLLTSTVDLRGLLERASQQIAVTLKAEQVFFFLYYTNTMKHHMSAGTHGHARLPVHDARVLDAYIGVSTEQIIMTDFIEDTRVRKMLLSHKVALVMPLRNAESIVGYVLLGNHMSGSYTKRDLGVLSTVSNELVIAIQNALSLHEVKELNATLQQRIDVATKELRSSNAQLKHLDEVKDEFMSMASHQLRTPLTSVKGYLSMVLDGDAGKLNPQQVKLLAEAFSSSERMVRLIADFLNVSRLQTGKFLVEKTDMNLKKMIAHEVTNLQVMADSRSLLLQFIAPKGDVIIRADEAKLREVVMNFIDNAIYYSKPDTTIKVVVEKHDDKVEFTVHDTGIGVPAAEQSRLFHKFFRATNARKQRPDGTGVGLYLARKIIIAHGGTIIFESVEGKGSVFGFKIPLAKLQK